MLNAVFAECHNQVYDAECRYAECHLTECRDAAQCALLLIIAVKSLI